MNEIQFSREIGRLLEKHRTADVVSIAVGVACAHYKLPAGRYKVLFALLACSRPTSSKTTTPFEQQRIYYTRFLSALSAAFNKFDHRFDLNTLIKQGYVNKTRYRGSKMLQLSDSFFHSITTEKPQ